jgi:Ni,Fe-hydrogenase III large subunit
MAENTRSYIPFGPQHPVLPEPIHLGLIVEDERVIEAVPSLGYVHRGLEKLIDKKDINQMVYVVERICGICSCMHALAYCQGIEELMNVEVPERARYLRTVWAEVHRMHSHLLWLGLLADALGYESLFMQAWRIREKVMDIMDRTAGNRVIISVNVIGGVKRDIDAETQKWVLQTLDDVEKELTEMYNIIKDDYTLRKRTEGIGVISSAEAYELGLVGPTARGSGLALDARMTGYAAYKDLGFEPVVEKAGDCYARMIVRVKELFQSIELVRKAFKQMPEGEIAVKVKGNPTGEVVSTVEQPRGELFYYMKADGTKNLKRMRIRTPTFANVAALFKILPGAALADVPLLFLTIDPCMSCTER